MLKTNHELRLDALRGLAAFSVAAGHCVTAWESGPIYALTVKEMQGAGLSAIVMKLLHLIFNADAAVIIFFVLSGHVLTRSLQKISLNYVAEFSKFATKRLFRLIPTTCISFLPLVFFVHADIARYIKNMLLLARDINGVTWSLQVEVFGSLLIFLVFMSRKRSKMALYILSTLIMAAYLLNKDTIFLKYFPAFLLGCVVDDLRRNYKDAMLKLLPLSVFMLLCGDFVLGYKTHLSIFLEIASSGIIIAAAPYSRFFAFLDRPVCAFLGKISFSFYLYHLTGAHIALYAFSVAGIHLSQASMVSSAVIYMAVSIPIAIFMATLSYYFVEKPSIVIGSQLGERIKQGLTFRPINASLPVAQGDSNK